MSGWRHLTGPRGHCLLIAFSGNSYSATPRNKILRPAPAGYFILSSSLLKPKIPATPVCRMRTAHSNPAVIFISGEHHRFFIRRAESYRPGIQNPDFGIFRMPGGGCFLHTLPASASQTRRIPCRVFRRRALPAPRLACRTDQKADG